MTMPDQHLGFAQTCRPQTPDKQTSGRRRPGIAWFDRSVLAGATGRSVTDGIYHEVRRAILSGALRAASRLPSTRTLSAQLGVSRSAVISAFEQLLGDGYAVGRKGSGTYIASDLPEPPEGRGGRQRRRTLTGQPAVCLPDFGDDSLDVMAANDELPFSLGGMLVDMRSVKMWRKLGTRTLRKIELNRFSCDHPQGRPELRRSICNYLQATRGVRCEPAQVVILAGIRQAAEIIGRIMKWHDRSIWIEDPGDPLMRLTLRAAGATVCPIPVDQHGINIAEGIRRAPKAGAVFVNPSHHFPKGVALSTPRRLELLAWARETGALIVENDYAGEFRFDGRPLTSLQGLDEADRVLYVGTLSKALLPGLPLSYAVVPSSLLRIFVTASRLFGCQPSNLCQAIAASFVDDGHFAGHIRRTRETYRSQRDALVAALKHHLSDHLTVETPDRGTHLIAYTRHGASDVVIERRAQEHGVVVRAMSRLYIEASPQSAVMLGFTGYPQQILRPAIARLVRAFEI